MRYKLTLEYDGTELLGWQRQNDGPSAQEYLETALLCLSGKDRIYTDERGVKHNPYAVFGKEAVTDVFCAGRTDAGVHALGQVAHFDLETVWEGWKLREALNYHLREAEAPVSVISAEPVADNFHARFSACGRHYLYKILNRRAYPVLQKNRVWWVPVPLNVEKMKQGASYLLGHHDFSAFRAAACQAKSPLKTLDRLDILTNGDEIDFIVEARSFLHHQVRNMVGTLKMVGDGHLQPEDIKTILNSRDRTKAGATAPACGLYLTKVIY